MSVFSYIGNRSFRGSEQQRFNVRAFISKYELWMRTFKEYQSNDRDNTQLYSKKQSTDITRMYGIKLNICFYIKECYISYRITSFEMRT
jgi:hypothetical protein